MSENTSTVSEISSTSSSASAIATTAPSSPNILESDQAINNNNKSKTNNHVDSLPQIKLPFPPVIDPSDLIHPSKPATSISAFDEPHKPSRAPNAFIIYRKAFVKAARDEGHCLPMTVISSMASSAWEKESEDVKTEYKRISKEAHLKKKAMYPKERRRRRKERWNVVSFQQPNIIKHHENNEDLGLYNNSNSNNNNTSTAANASISGNLGNEYYFAPESQTNYPNQQLTQLIDLFSTPDISMFENYENNNQSCTYINNNNNNNNNSNNNSMMAINNEYGVFLVNSLINDTTNNNCSNNNNNDLFQLEQQQQQQQQQRQSGDFSFLNLLNAANTPDLSSSEENYSNISSPYLSNDDESIIINNNNNKYLLSDISDDNLFNFNNISDICSTTTTNDLLNHIKPSPSTSSSPLLSISDNNSTSPLLPSFFDNVPEFNYGLLY